MLDFVLPQATQRLNCSFAAHHSTRRSTPIQTYLLVTVVGDEDGVFAGDGVKELEHHFLFAGPGVDEENVDFVEADVHSVIAGCFGLVPKTVVGYLLGTG